MIVIVPDQSEITPGPDFILESYSKSARMAFIATSVPTAGIVLPAGM